MTRLPGMLLVAALAACAAPTVEQEASADEQAPAPSGAAFLRTADGERLDARAAARRLAEADVVFLGELHDSDPGHVLLAELLSALGDEADARGRTLTLSMEQFERDVQDLVDDYLLGRIDEERFLAESRPWRNYHPHYSPLIEESKARAWDVLAANVPRRIAARVFRYGEASGRGALFAALEVDANEGEYRRRFVEVMNHASDGHTAGEDATSEDGADHRADDGMQNLFAAQAIKDDTMAETIAQHMATDRARRHGPPLVVHLCGRFHSDWGLGTVERLVAREPALEVALVSMRTREELDELANEPEPPAEILLVIP